jgi:uncharacterized protein (TIGR00369 family)
MIKEPEYRSVDFSRTTITELMIPSYANFGGKIHGGIILSLMDKVAYACSARHAGGYCVTASINATDFLAPVNVGDLVSLHASVNHVGKSSMVIGIRVESINVTTNEKIHTNTSYFTMIAMTEDRKPRVVPGLILENRKDVRRFLEAIRRKELIKQYKSEFSETLSDEEIQGNLHRLEEERCMVIDF